MVEPTTVKKKNDEVKKEDNPLIPGNESDEDWITKKWRPMMAMMYMTCCLVDFVIFPIMFTIVQFWETEAVNDAFRQWVPITLQGGGLFHVAMGAVLGVSAFGRTQEKIAGAAGSAPYGLPTQPLTHTPQPYPPSGMMSGGMMPAQNLMYMQQNTNMGRMVSPYSMPQGPQEPEPLGKGGLPLVRPGAYD